MIKYIRKQSQREDVSGKIIKHGLRLNKEITICYSG
jgi:hypothetical protein